MHEELFDELHSRSFVVLGAQLRLGAEAEIEIPACGRCNAAAWSAAFAMVAAIMLASLLIFVGMRPRVPAGDRGT